MKKLFLLLLVIPIILGGCKKSEEPDNSVSPHVYHIKGRLFRDCSSNPMSRYPLRVESNSIVLKRDTTDANGYFDIEVDSQISYVKVVHDTSLNFSDFSLSDRLDFNPQFGQTYEWGTIYKQWIKNAFFRITFNQVPTSGGDSFYLGLTKDPGGVSKTYIGSPASDIELFQPQYYNGSGIGFGYIVADTFKMYWGRTKKEYDSVIDLNPSGFHFISTFHLLKAPTRLCAPADTTRFFNLL